MISDLLTIGGGIVKLLLDRFLTPELREKLGSYENKAEAMLEPIFQAMTAALQQEDLLRFVLARTVGFELPEDIELKIYELQAPYLAKAEALLNRSGFVEKGGN